MKKRNEEVMQKIKKTTRKIPDLVNKIEILKKKIFEFTIFLLLCPILALTTGHRLLIDYPEVVFIRFALFSGVITAIYYKDIYAFYSLKKELARRIKELFALRENLYEEVEEPISSNNKNESYKMLLKNFKLGLLRKKLIQTYGYSEYNALELEKDLFENSEFEEKSL